MSKHESTITLTQYIVSMVLVTLISLGVGIGCGYGISKIKDGSLSNTKSVVTNPAPSKSVVKQDQTTQESKESDIDGDSEDLNGGKEVVETQSLTSTQQQEISKKTVQTFYNINSAMYSQLYDESLAKSKSIGKSQDAVFKELLTEEYEKVLTGHSLNDINKFISGGSIKNYYFSDFYNSKRNTSIQSYSIDEYKNNILKVSSQVTNTFFYYSIPNSDYFLTTLKGKGITKEQYIKIVNMKPLKIKVKVTSEDKFNIENVKDKWLISNHESSLISTEIVEIVFQTKTWTLKDFASKYF